jgi:hypothetical protein
MSNNHPRFYGLITTDNPTGSFTKIGKLALWKQNVAPTTKRPPYAGNLEINGKKYKVALWENAGE